MVLFVRIRSAALRLKNTSSLNRTVIDCGLALKVNAPDSTVGAVVSTIPGVPPAVALAIQLAERDRFGFGPGLTTCSVRPAPSVLGYHASLYVKSATVWLNVSCKPTCSPPLLKLVPDAP